MLKQTFKNTFFIMAAMATVIALVQTADASESAAPACSFKKTTMGAKLISLEEAIEASGLSLSGRNPIKPLRNVSGMVLLANSENDIVGHVVSCPNSTAIMKLFGSEPLVISSLR